MIHTVLKYFYVKVIVFCSPGSQLYCLFVICVNSWQSNNVKLYINLVIARLQVGSYPKQ